MGVPEVGSEFSMAVGFTPVHGTPISMGNPHYVVFVDEFSPRWQAEGAEIGRHKDFKQGINVEFVRLKSEHDIEARFYERGVGETQSSGTGSCASAVAAIAAGHVKSPVKVHAVGGTQVVRWTDGKVFLRGPAQLICQGEYFG
jgi:diaminopimelate epimerase